jgi:hypothetical protein
MVSGSQGEKPESIPYINRRIAPGPGLEPAPIVKRNPVRGRIGEPKEI